MAECQQYNEGSKSVHHFLFTCSAYVRQHNNMRMLLRMKAHHIKHILNETNCLKSLFKYIINTKRFASVFGDVLSPKELNCTSS